MATKTLKTRIQNKADTTANWSAATSFIPLKGEIILYTDTNKIKIGDGTSLLSSLDYANLTEDDIGEGELIDINNGALTLQIGGNTKATFTANQSSDTTFNVTAADLGLTGALNFVGISSTDPTDPEGTGATVPGYTAWKKGDVVLYKPSGATTFNEYVLIENSNIPANWEKLGDESSFALKSVRITGTGALSGGGSLSTNQTITHNTGSASSVALGLYKIATDSYSHISSTAAVSKADITGLGIPAADTNQKIKVGSATFSADAEIGLSGGDNVTITTGTNTVTISAKDTTYTAGDNITITGTTISAKDTITTASDSGTGNVVTSVVADASGHLTITKGSAGNGTVTSVAVKMNGTTKGTITSAGTVDLGTVITSHQDISGKEDASNKVTSITSAATDTQYPTAKAIYDMLEPVSTISVYTEAEADAKFVVQISGKGLSTNDYTTAEKTKLSGIAAGAQVNAVTDVQVNGTSVLSNKIANVSVPTKVSQLQNDSGYTTNTGTVTSVGITMNGSSKGTVTTSGTIDLGTVITSHQDISGKQDKLTAGTNIAISSANVISATDTVTTATTTGSGNAVTEITASNGQLTITKGTTFLTSHQDISGKEDKSNKVTSLSATSTDDQYPTAKCMYDMVGNVESVLANLIGG